MPPASSSQLRTTDTHALSSSVPSSLSSSSLASSRASSDLLPAAPRSNSSHSDIIPSSDPALSSHSSSTKHRFLPLSLTPSHTSPASRPTPPPFAMGQSYARPQGAASPPPLSPATSSSSGAGSRLKRAWAGRRKKSEDITAMLSGSDTEGRSRDRYGGAPPSVVPEIGGDMKLERQTSRGLGAPKLLNLQNVFGGRKASHQYPQAQHPNQQEVVGPWAMSPLSPAPPTPPPKPRQAGSQMPSPPRTPEKDTYAPATAAVPRPSPLPLPHAHHSRRPSETGDEGLSTGAEKDGVPEKTKEDWRKSDATMTSHVTVRPGALSGNRSPRPVSLAESSHSGNTIVPPVNKRLSALITEAEFTMFEEADGSISDHESVPRPPTSGRPSPTNSLKARNRRSASLSITHVRRPETTPPTLHVQSPARNFSDSPLASTRDTPTLTRAAAAGIIAPVSTGGATLSTSHNIRGRLAAWTAVSASTPQTPIERPLPAPPPPQPRRQPGQPQPPPVNPTFRQTAVSMTGSLAPAAGFAMGFGKRAVEKVGRAWGGLTSSSSTHSGYSSSSSVGMSDSASGYASSHNSGPGKKGRKKVAPPAFSNTSSISSLASSSEDQFAPVGPILGKRLRPARTSGLVFRRDLRSCVRETAIAEVQMRLAEGKGAEEAGFGNLESRLLPALVLRCAQHILRWGVQEEGLFRISGRSSHVAKLRSEFDGGADYILAECDPGDLDPHAVSSILKTFLRELPEPVLTSALLPYFEQALVDEQARRSEEPKQSPKPDLKYGSNLPLRKPPSLSTLAMPTFAGARAISESQVTTFTWLISKLPPENRDLVYTVVELIKHTAARSKETKMPLGNLLLVFCPSLTMSPPLLRVLCEAEGIWNGPPAGPEPSRGPQPHAADNAPISNSTASSSQTIDMRLPVIEMDDTPETPRDSPDDAASFVSALEPPSHAPTRTPSPLIYGTTIPPLSSSDSLDSSSVSEELVSPEPSFCKATTDIKSFGSAHSLSIPDVASVSLPSAGGRPADITVPFPSSGGSVPHSPITPAPLSHRKSYTLLSFPHLRSESSPEAIDDRKRPLRPSLHLLFTKKSSSSLPSGTGSSCVASATPGVGTEPLSFVSSPPPRLDTDISSSPIQLGFDPSATHLRDQATVRTLMANRAAPAEADLPKLEVPAIASRSDSGGSSVFSTPQSTPIADFYRGRTTSLFLPDTPADLAPPQANRMRSASQVSETPSIDIEVADTQQDDWTASVLLAAGQGS